MYLVVYSYNITNKTNNKTLYLEYLKFLKHDLTGFAKKNKYNDHLSP